MKYRSFILNHGHHRMSIAAYVLLSLFLLAPAAALAKDLPVVEVRFNIDAGDRFDEILPQLGEIKTAVEDKVRGKAQKNYGFLNWLPDDEATNESARWNVTLKVEKRQVPIDENTTKTHYVGTLNHSWQLAGNEDLFEQSPQDQEIYPLGKSIPFRDATTLRKNLLAQLDEPLDKLLKSGDDVKWFVSNIPLVDKVITAVIKGEKLILVPVKRRDLRAKNDSVLAVKFTHESKEGQLDLEPRDEVGEAGQYNGFVVGRVTDLSLRSVELEKIPTWWDDKLSDLLPTGKEVKVYMMTYKPNLGGEVISVNGIASEPEIEGETP